MALALLAALALGEVAARIFVAEETLFNRPDRWEPHPRLGRVLRADHAYSARGVPYRTNSRHLRDREFPPDKPGGVFRVVVVGDSFVFGIGPLETIFPKVLEQRLGERFDGAVEVMSVGLPACGTSWVQEARP